MTASRQTLDQGRAFQAYCLLGGSAQKTALLCQTTPEVIEALARDFQWGKSVRTDIGDKSKLEAFKTLNRLSALMLGDCIRKIANKIACRMADDPEFCRAMLTKLGHGPDGLVTRFDAGALVALTKAAATAIELTNRALGDTGGAAPTVRGDPVAAAVATYGKLSQRFAARTDVTLATAKVVGG